MHEIFYFYVVQDRYIRNDKIRIECRLIDGKMDKIILRIYVGAEMNLDLCWEYRNGDRSDDENHAIRHAVVDVEQYSLQNNVPIHPSQTGRYRCLDHCYDIIRIIMHIISLKTDNWTMLSM